MLRVRRKRATVILMDEAGGSSSSTTLAIVLDQTQSSAAAVQTPVLSAPPNECQQLAWQPMRSLQQQTRCRKHRSVASPAVEAKRTIVVFNHFQTLI
jgi:hypothetical protein